MTTKLQRSLSIVGLLLLGGLGGAMVAFLIAIPIATNWCNTRVSDVVVPRAGIPTHSIPGPHTITTTPPVVTPLVRP